MLPGLVCVFPSPNYGSLAFSSVWGRENRELVSKGYRVPVGKGEKVLHTDDGNDYTTM